MALSQVQVIQSLAEALSWFEKELDWGVSPAELNHLTGRIGELYAAMITRGQMALDTNQRGYDVISAENEHISVKTVTSSTQVTFNRNTFDLVDRVMVFRVNIDDEDGISVETILDCVANKILDEQSDSANKIVYKIPSVSRPVKSLDSLQVSRSAAHKKYIVRQYENGKIVVLADNVLQPIAKPLLREIATEIGVETLGNKGGRINTRQLGAHIINKLEAATADCG